LKSLEAQSLDSTEFWYHIKASAKYATRAMKSGQVVISDCLFALDELDRTARALTNAYTTSRSTFIDRCGALGDDHWVTFFITHMSKPTFYHLMAMWGVHQYLESRLTDEIVQENDGDNGRTPLLLAAIEDFGLTSNGDDDLRGPHLEAVKVLLQKGADLHRQYKCCSAFTTARALRVPFDQSFPDGASCTSSPNLPEISKRLANPGLDHVYCEMNSIFEQFGRLPHQYALRSNEDKSISSRSFCSDTDSMLVLAAGWTKDGEFLGTLQENFDEGIILKNGRMLKLSCAMLMAIQEDF
jgi:hypothetical protein